MDLNFLGISKLEIPCKSIVNLLKPYLDQIFQFHSLYEENKFFEDDLYTYKFMVGQIRNLVKNYCTTMEKCVAGHQDLEFELSRASAESQLAFRQFSRAADLLCEYIKENARIDIYDPLKTSKQDFNSCDHQRLIRSSKRLTLTLIQILCIADKVLIKQLNTLKSKILMCIQRMIRENTFTRFINSFSDFGAAMIEFGKLSGERQSDLTCEEKRYKLGICRSILERIIPILLACFKLCLRYSESTISNRLRGLMLENLKFYINEIIDLSSFKITLEEVHIKDGEDDTLKRQSGDPSHFSIEKNELSYLSQQIVEAKSTMKEDEKYIWSLAKLIKKLVDDFIGNGDNIPSLESLNQESRKMSVDSITSRFSYNSDLTQIMLQVNRFCQNVSQMTKLKSLRDFGEVDLALTTTRDLIKEFCREAQIHANKGDELRKSRLLVQLGRRLNQSVDGIIDELYDCIHDSACEIFMSNKGRPIPSLEVIDKAIAMLSDPNPDLMSYEATIRDLTDNTMRINQISKLLSQVSLSHCFSSVAILVEKYILELSELFILSFNVNQTLGSIFHIKEIISGLREAWTSFMNDAANLIIDIDTLKEDRQTVNKQKFLKIEKLTRSCERKSTSLRRVPSLKRNNSQTKDSTYLPPRPPTREESLRINEKSRQPCPTNDDLKKVKSLDSLKVMKNQNDLQNDLRNTIKYPYPHRNEPIYAEQTHIEKRFGDLYSNQVPFNSSNIDLRLNDVNSAYISLTDRPKSSMEVKNFRNSQGTSNIKPLSVNDQMRMNQERKVIKCYYLNMVGFTNCTGPLQTTSELFRLAEILYLNVERCMLKVCLPILQYEKITVLNEEIINLKEELNRVVTGKIQTFAKVDNVVQISKRIIAKFESLLDHRLFIDSQTKNSFILTLSSSSQKSLNDQNRLSFKCY